MTQTKTFTAGQAVIDVESGICGEVVEVAGAEVKIVTGPNRRPSWMHESELASR